MKEKYDITGMSCSACSARVEKEVAKAPGVKEVAVNLLTNNMVVEYDEKATNPQAIVATVEAAGYGAFLANQGQTAKAQPKTADQALAQMYFRLKTSIVFLVPLFYLSMGRMLNWPMPQILQGPQNLGILGLLLLLLSIPILIINRKFFITGYKTLWQKAPNMDTLIAVGTTAAFAYGVVALFQIEAALGAGDMNSAMTAARGLYFESAGMILTMITIGKTLETRSKGKTSEAIEKLIDLTPKTALVLKEGEEIEIAVDQVQVGDHIRIKPGKGIPVDGVVFSGESSIDEAALTGESMPVDKGPGDRVLSGSMNQNGSLILETTKTGENTTLAQMIQLVETAASSKAPVARLADKISGIFVPVVLGLSLLTFLIWFIATNDVQSAFNFAISVMVISCPCALGLATPVAIMVGTGKGAEQGVLFRSAEAIETLQKSQVVVLDKTGTITYGKPVVTDIIPFNEMSKTTFLTLAASLENQSEHPLSTAVVTQALNDGVVLEEAKAFKAYTGQGVSASIQGQSLYAGNQAFMQAQKISVDGASQQISSLTQAGKTPMYFANEDGLIGIIAVADQIKEDAQAAIAQMKALGLTVYMLTGDHQVTAEAVGKVVGIDHVMAEVSPQNKEAAVRKLQAEGQQVIVVGDGINDAPALTRADTGIAIGAGADIAIESADVVLMRNTLVDVVSAIELSKATLKNIKENLFWAFFYNVIGIPIAAGVFYPAFNLGLSPWVAATAMSLSSVTVVLNALRLKKFKPSFSQAGSKQKASKAPESHEIQDALETTAILPKSAIQIERKKPMLEKRMIVEGMMCEHCQARVKETLENLEAVEQATVNLETKEVSMRLNQPIENTRLKEAIAQAGYEVTQID